MNSVAWRMISPAIARNRRPLVMVLCWSLLGTVPTLLSGVLVAVALDRGFLAGDAGFGLAVLGCYGASLGLGAVATRQAMGPMAVFAEAVRDHLVHKVVHTSLHAAVSAGTAARTGFAARIVGQTETVRQILSNLVMAISSAVLMTIAACAGLVTLVPAMVIALVPILLPAAFLLVRLSKVWRRRYEESLACEEELAAELDLVLTGTRDIAACGAAGRAGDDVDRRLRASARAATGVAGLSGARIGVIGLAGHLPLIVLLLLAPALVSRGALTTGELVGAITYLATGLEPAWRAITELLGNQALEVATVLRRLSGTEIPPEHDGSLEASRYDLALRGATFRYGPQSEPIFENTDLTLAEGTRLVVVGPSGIGKSTLVNVFAGLEAPEAGSVTLGGVDLKDLRTQWLRRSVALVPQEAYVFAGTVRENLAYLAPAAEDAELVDTAAIFGLAELISRYGGLDGEIRPDTLSVGERQLVTLARVYLSPARVVILDEATCHLDPRAEAVAEEAFARRPGTLIMVAHRISSAMRAERVLLMGAGSLVQGTHEELLHSSPDYARLVDYWTRDAGATVDQGRWRAAITAGGGS
ncbi:ATP-binding cassette domain-containing protein [Amycolatopsis magusensis]|uniref:ATP-binding cassette domain-containing protein n=1 Tax=Amycolatopsis magusensis TaxID=882444 RepID=UPI0024A8F269|nr:ABC transporter ATP-binding protein [Amycolatopsis magusensis]MDI5980188.1 ABC transporter ATP-binding protein [Amycolatopsis magusensis]